MAKELFDAVVIGGGPGGYVCAIGLAQHGVKTALIEKDSVGGTCLNRGCIPAKSLLQSASVYRTAKEAATFGINVEGVSFDFGKIMERKDKVVGTLVNGVKGLLRGNGVELINGEAKITSKTTVKVGDREIEFKNLVIAAGSMPGRLGPIEGITSDDFFKLDKFPETATIIGCGVIGIEFATFLNTLGTKVTMYDVLPEILGSGVDADIAAMLRADLESRGIEFHLGVKFDPATAPKADLQVIAAGRKPLTKDLGCEAAGIKVSERGFIEVDEYCRTNVEGIYAIGDINGKVMLAHAASEQGDIVAHNIAAGKAEKTADFAHVPSCIYTDPEIALIGLSEEKAKEQGYEPIVGIFTSVGNGKSLVVNETRGFVKVVADKTTHEILGLRLFCAHATDMLGEGIAAIKLESTLEEIGDAIHPHPTVNEMIMEAVHDALGHCVHKVYKKKK